MKLNEIKEGDKLVADAGFTCMKDGQVGAVVRTEEGALAVPCDAGHHLLDGQVDDANGEVIGLAKCGE